MTTRNAWEWVEEIGEAAIRADAAKNGTNVKVKKPKAKRGNTGAMAWNEFGLEAEAERLYGPHNPTILSDYVLGLMELDPTIGLALEIWKTAYQGVEYWVTGNSPELVGFAEEMWKKNQRDWIRVFLNALVWGRSSSEIVWGQKDVAFDYNSDPKPKEKDPGAQGGFGGEFGPDENNGGSIVHTLKKQAFVIDQLRDYDPRHVTLRRTKERGDYAGFRVDDKVFLPSETVHTIFQRRFGSLRGRALHFRSHKPWWESNLVYLGANRYLERKGDPPLIGYAPTDETQDADGNVQDPVRVMAVAAANIRSGASYIMPGELDPETRQRLYELRELMVADRADEYLSIAQHLESLKAIGALTAPDLTGSSSGSSGGGAFAGKKVSRRQQHNLFSGAQDELIIRPANRWLIPKLIRANFGDVPDQDMPVVHGGRMSENALEVIGELVRANQKAASITKDGREIEVGSRIDYQAAFQALGVPTIDESAIPDKKPDLPPGFMGPDGEPGKGPDGKPGGPPGKGPDKGKGFPSGGRPPAIKTNPNRPEGSTERGFDREVIEVSSSSWARDLDDTSATEWFRAARETMTDMDRIVNKADAAVMRAHLSNQKKIRRMLSRTIREAEKTTTKDGRKVFSSKNRRGAKGLRKDVERLLLESEKKLLNEKDIVAASFARRSPLAAAHIDVSKAAGEWLEDFRLSRPRGGRMARVVKDVVRDAKTNAIAQPTLEARHVQESFDRMVQAGVDIQSAEEWAETYTLPDRNQRLSTVSHVRGSARAALGNPEVIASDDVGGWVAMVSPQAEKRLLDRSPDGRVSKINFKPFGSTADLDVWFQDMVKSTGQPQTSWRNLGLHQFSEEYYMPVHKVLWPAVLALVNDKRQKFTEKRKEANERFKLEADLAALRERPDVLELSEDIIELRELVEAKQDQTQEFDAAARAKSEEAEAERERRHKELLTALSAERTLKMEEGAIQFAAGGNEPSELRAVLEVPEGAIQVNVEAPEVKVEVPEDAINVQVEVKPKPKTVKSTITKRHPDGSAKQITTVEE